MIHFMNCLKYMKYIAVLSVILLSGFSLMAGKITSHKGDVKNGYNFWLYDPTESNSKTDTINNKPVVIFLHGASLCGSNLERVRRYGTIDAIEKGRELDAYVIAPQNPGGAWNPQRVMSILDYICETHKNIDKDRIYVIGMSLGGYGTIDLVATYPDRIAAAIAMCGGGTVSDYKGLNEVPLWIVHGTADRAVKISESDKVVSKMKSFSGDTPRLIYNRIPGMNHSQPARMFYLKESYDWLFSHNLKDWNRPVKEAFDVKGTMGKAYMGLDNSGSYKKKNKSVSKKKRSRYSKRKSRKRRG